MPPRPALGAPAPAFALPGVRLVGGDLLRAEYSLARAVGAPLVLAFYPGDDTPVCTKQMCSYSSGLEAFTDLGAAVWGISTQDLASHERFARKHDLRLPLLSDADKTVVKAYGVAGPLGLHTARSVFVLDAAGVLRWSHVSSVGLAYQQSATLVDVVRGLVAT